MQKRTVTTIQRSWVFLNVALVLLPLYHAARGDNSSAADAVGIALMSVFLLSFPTSTLAIPFIIVFAMAFEIPKLNPHYTIFYAVLLIFALGSVQWFWIFPRMTFGGRDIETLDLPDGGIAAAARELQAGWGNSADARSPFERVMREYEKL